VTGRFHRKRLGAFVGASCVLWLLGNGAAAACDTVSAARLIDLVNGLRDEYALSAIARDARLDRAATKHAEELARRHMLDHDSENGDHLDARANKAGYQYRLIVENLAFGTEDPAEVIKLWLGSDGHRDNLLQAEVLDTGVGCANNYWVLVLARPIG
jgi:uncharacterized protein YkwD